MKRRRGPSSVVFGSARIAVTDPSRPTSAPQHSCGYVACPCSRIARSTAAVTAIRRSLVMGAPERLVEVFLGAVGKDGDDHTAVQSFRDVQHRRHGGA